MNGNESNEINSFYVWARDYWCELSKDAERGFSGLLNFGCWDSGAGNLYEAQERLFALIVEHLFPFPAGRHGLEIGCGIGGNSIRLCSRMPVTMTAMDISPVQLALAAQLADQAGQADKITFMRGDSMAMPFADASFDFSICVESSFHYEAIDRFVAEQARVLKPGAMAVIADITCDNVAGVRFRQGNHFYSAAAMQDLLRDNGLELVHLRRVGSDVFVPLYDYVRRFSGASKQKVSKYWNLVLCNYAQLAQEGAMGYDIFTVRRPPA